MTTRVLSCAFCRVPSAWNSAMVRRLPPALAQWPRRSGGAVSAAAAHPAAHSLRTLCRGGTDRRAFASSAAATAESAPPQANKAPRHLAVRAGLPFVLFSVLAAWVVASALDGKLKEQDVAQGKSSVSLRQAKLQEEHDEMVARLNKIVAADFDNTKRIKRPHEILEERRLERERRNKWYRRWWQAIVREKKDP